MFMPPVPNSIKLVEESRSLPSFALFLFIHIMFLCFLTLISYSIQQTSDSLPLQDMAPSIVVSAACSIKHVIPLKTMILRCSDI